MKMPVSLFATAVLLGSTALYADEWEPPMTSWGAPDLQGIWDYSSRTALERHPRFEGKLVVTQEEAERLVASLEEYTDALEEVGAEAPGPDNVGAYNAFWIHPGEWLAQIDGELRTSFIIEPEDGRIPWREDGREARAGQRATMSFDHIQQNAGPEGFTLAERCLISFASVVPFLPSLYNNNIQIVQAETHVMILAEMVNDARIVRLNADLPEDPLPRWHGSSVGHYEGDELVVRTRGFHPAQVARGGGHTSENAVITERFRRVADNELRYSFTVEDPDLYTEAWTAEMPMYSGENMYEYACHEGNYSMPGILAGARLGESPETESP